MFWMRGLAFILGLKAEASGNFVTNPSLIVSNHISWLDIVVISAHGSCTFVSKSDVKNWPVIGWLANLSGTLFVQRDAKWAINETKQKIQTSLKNGRSVVVFPEGTTTNGNSVKPFKSALYQSISEFGGTIQAIALHYSTISGDYSHAAYIDDDDFVTHLLRVMQMPETRVKLTLLAPHHCEKNSDRKELADLTYQQICLVKQTNTETALY